MAIGTSARDPFRWRSALVLVVLSEFLLLLLKQYSYALGAGLGFALFAGNLLLMLEIGRALLRRSPDGHPNPKPWAAISSSSRLLFLAGALSLIAIYLGREVLLGACGGFFAAQVNLHIPRWGRMREER